MFRSITSTILARKLCNHYPTGFQIATFIRTPINYDNHREREPCPVPSPPPPPPKDDRMLWATLTVLIGIGAFTVFAKKNPEVRDWLTISAPWYDDFIAIVFEENMTYGEFALACLDNMKKKYLRKNKQDTEPKECSTGGGPVKDCTVVAEPPKEEGKPKKCTPPAPERSLCDIEKCMIELAECAINNHNTAKEACARYNALVRGTMETFTYKGMKELRHAMEKRREVVKTSLKKASHCISKFEELGRHMECGVRGTEEQIKKVKLIFEDYNDRIKASFIKYQWENDKSVVIDKQWQMVEQMVETYTSANEYMFAGLKYSSPKLQATGDLDALFTGTLRYIEALQSQLPDVSASMTERIDRAIEDLPQKGSPAFVAALANAIKEKKADTAKIFKRREDELKAKNDRELKEAIHKLNVSHEKNLAAKLEQIEEQVMVKFNKMVDDEVAREKSGFAAEIGKMSAKIKVVEDKLEERLKAERETRRSQELWAAGASLLAATKKGDPKVKVDRELKAIEKASGENDKLVITVLKSIPKSVREHGIVPETVLRDRFHSMEKIARSVALVEQEGSAMPVYILSWLQGLLLFMKMTGIPQSEFEKPPLAPADHLDTYDLLQRARFWVDRGNLAVAVRYVDSLKGASRAAASKWYDDARAYLEVRQAAEAVLAHAAALGLQYI